MSVRNYTAFRRKQQSCTRELGSVVLRSYCLSNVTVIGKDAQLGDRLLPERENTSPSCVSTFAW